jgi:hypothetical protein
MIDGVVMVLGGAGVLRRIVCNSIAPACSCTHHVASSIVNITTIGKIGGTWTPEQPAMPSPAVAHQVTSSLLLRL